MKPRRNFTTSIKTCRLVDDRPEEILRSNLGFGPFYLICGLLMLGVVAVSAFLAYEQVTTELAFRRTANNTDLVSEVWRELLEPTPILTYLLITASILFILYGVWRITVRWSVSDDGYGEICLEFRGWIARTKDWYPPESVVVGIGFARPAVSHVHFSPSVLVLIGDTCLMYDDSADKRDVNAIASDVARKIGTSVLDAQPEVWSLIPPGTH